MHSLWKRGLALAGLVLGAGGWLSPPALQAGGGSAWTPAAVGQPIAEAATPAASLDRPVAGPVDGQVRPTAFTISSGDPTPVYSAQSPGVFGPRPMPVGPSLNDGGVSPTPYTWRQAPNPTPAAPGAPAAPGTVLPSPPMMPGADNGTVTTPPNGSVIVAPNGSVPYGPGGVIMGVPGAPAAVGPGAPGGVVLPGPGGPDGCCVPGGVCCDPSCCCGTCCPGTCCDGCGGCCDGCCNGCCFNNRWYGTAEYLYWWVRGTPTPPLITTGSAADQFPGAIGQPGTQVLFGGSTLGTGPRSGFRFLGGYWLNDCHTLGVEAGAFFLFNQTNNFSAASNPMGSPVLARPFVDGVTGAQTEELVSLPNVVAGSVAAHTSSSFWGAELNARHNFCCGCNWYVDGLVGFRYLGLNESVSVAENLTIIAPGPFQGTTALVNDRFATQNRFYGTQLGFAGEYRFDRFFVGGRAVIGLGPTQQIVDITGTTIDTVPGGTPVKSTGGLLAQSTNIGRHTRDYFGVVPEVGLNVGYQITNNLRVFAGYNFLFWNSVVRAGNQIDQRVNPSFIPPATPSSPAVPAFSFHGSEFWAQGLTFGIEFRY
jgi:hypothetical protein